MTASLSFQVASPSTVAAKIQADYVAVRVSFEPWLPSTKKPRVQTQAAMASAARVDRKSVKANLAKYNTEIPSIRAANAVRTAIKAYVESVTVYGPYTSLHFLLRSDLPAFEAQMNAFATAVKSAAIIVQRDRKLIVDDAQTRLNGEFDAGDYPQDLSKLFGFAWDYPSVQVDQNLPEEILEPKNRQLETQLALDAQRVELALLEEFQDFAAHLAKCLKLKKGDEGAKWHQSAIDNLAKFIERAKRLSILQSSVLVDNCREALKLIDGAEAADLKEHPRVSAKLSDMLSVLIAKANGTYVDPNTQQPTGQSFWDSLPPELQPPKDDTCIVI